MKNKIVNCVVCGLSLSGDELVESTSEPTEFHAHPECFASFDSAEDFVRFARAKSMHMDPDYIPVVTGVNRRDRSLGL